MNPSAKHQIHQYSQSVSELFKMMIQEREEEFGKRVYKVIRTVTKPLVLIDTFHD
jgi:hypothetical protein